jgi:pyruvate/2-oxoglutarate dehydrogenase complex dihydrolipoamide dehydrogenase (E3) component
MNPDLGREGEPEVEISRPKRVIIINGGPAGIEAARVAALRGHQVKLWDEKPTLTHRWSWLLKPYIGNRINLLTKLRVEVELGKTISPETLAEENPEVVIIGRGLSVPKPSIQGLEGLSPIQAEDILEGKAEVEGNIVILGGTNIGFEVANLLIRKGCHVWVIEEGHILGNGMEPLTRNVMLRRLAGRGVVLHRHARVTQMEPGLVIFTDKKSGEQRLSFHHIIIATHGEPNEDLIKRLGDGDYDVIPVGPYQQPVQYLQAFKEGTSIGRSL